jgi:hypothetical protein
MALTSGSLLVGILLVWALFFTPTLIKRLREGEQVKSVIGWYFGVSWLSFSLLLLLGWIESHG